MNETKPNRILVEFNENRAWCDVVDWLATDVAVIQWTQPDGTIVGATAVDLGEKHPETGEPVWTWDGQMTAVTEEQEA